MSKSTEEREMVAVERLSSSPVYDTEIIEMAKMCIEPPKGVSTSLQKMDDSDLYMWHYRPQGSVYWHGDGKPMIIRKVS